MDAPLSPRHDPKLLEIAGDVVVRFKEHDQYKGEAGALKAMKRRAPEFSDDDCRAAFDLMSRVLDRAVEAIGRHRVDRPDKKSRFAEPEDIDFDACMQELETIEPGVGTSQKGSLLNWAIFWHYLK